VEAPLEAVQAALDHSNLATTSVYLHLGLPAPAGGAGGSLVAQAGPRAGLGGWGRDGDRRPRLRRRGSDGGRARA
jgi:hypothetical protein